MIDVKIQVSAGGKTFNSITEFLAFRQNIGSTRSKVGKTELAKSLNRAYKYLSDIVDLVIAEQVGGTLISARSGRGFQADIINVESGEISEIKSITTKLTQQGTISATKISLGGLGIKTIKEISLNLASDTKEQIVEQYALSGKAQETFASILFKKNSEEKKKWLNETSKRDTPYGRAAKQIISNIETKSSKIYVSTPSISGGSEIREIGWNWSDILKNPRASIVNKDENSIDIIFSENLVTEALNSTKVINAYRDLSNNALEEIQNLLNKAGFTSEVFVQLANLGTDFEFDKLIKYEKGSIKVYSLSIIEKKSNKLISTSNIKAISNTELTALVQKITKEKMPEGPLRGPPLSSTVLTYRSGQFVDSIKVIQDMRQQLIKYYYAPNYRIHEKRGARAPRFLLQSSIREAVKQVYGTQFRIIRGF